MKMTIIWVVTPSEVEGRYKRLFRDELHSACSTETLVSTDKTLVPTDKSTTEKTNIDIISAMRTSNFILP
jgi:hypothetical protein